MYLEKLKLVNFKNYSEETLSFSRHINCFFGNNGVGKTNILDAIYYLSLCKSYFNNIDHYNIRHEEDFFFLEGIYERKDEKEEIYCGVVRNKKKSFKRNQKEYPRLADHIGFLPAVMISPNDSGLITEGSEERRKFINNVISQFDHEYLNSLIRYNKALQQRNKLLKDFARQGIFQKDMLEIYDDQLVQHGQYIYDKRIDFTEKLTPMFNQYYQEISGNEEKVALIYESPLQKEPLDQLLTQTLEKDRLLQYTTTGIHKDDLCMSLEGRPIKRSGSQGQQKSFLVALKFAKSEFIQSITGLKPILLLDDIFDKFDHKRVQQILKIVSDDHFGQIFITDTNKDRLDYILSELSFEHKIFNVHNNTIHSLEK